MTWLFLVPLLSSARISDGLAADLSLVKPHRAVYDISLEEASDRSGILGMTGRIVHEITGSACDGFAVRFRFLTKVRTASKNFTSDHRTTSFESGDGSGFRFVTQAYLNGQLEREVRGFAERDTTGTKVQLTKPQDADLILPSSVFMTEHMAMIIEAAISEQTIVTATLYDGSENGDELVDTTAIIGKKKVQVPAIDGETSELAGLFTDAPGWPVTVSYFSAEEVPDQGEKLPIYSVSFIMHDNGVSRRLKMNYEDYQLRGDLKEIEFLPSEPCN